MGIWSYSKHRRRRRVQRKMRVEREQREGFGGACKKAGI